MANIKDKGLDPTPDSNPDPITGEPGAHPVGVAGGGTGGALAGAAIGGAVGGPIGAAIGGAIGAVAGGLAGKGAAEAVNPTEEDSYWRQNYANRPYVQPGHDYDTHYGSAYKYGWESATSPTYTGRAWNDVEPHLEKNWSTQGGASGRNWNDVRDATRDAYERVHARTSSGVTRATETTRDAGSYVGDKADSVWEQVKGNWHQMKGSIRERWNDLTDDEIEQMDGRREKIVGKIQEKYGEAKWKEADIENELRGFRR